MTPAGVSYTIERPSPPGMSSPRSRAIVVTAMMPCPHMELYPSLCMNNRPACDPGDTGSVSRAPYMSARLAHKGTAEMVVVGPDPLAFIRHRAADRRREAVDH